MKYPILLTLTVEIQPQPEGVYIGHCNELDIETCGKTVEEARDRSLDMICAYFRACQKDGTFGAEMARLVQGQQKQTMRLATNGILGLIGSNIARKILEHVLRGVARHVEHTGIMRSLGPGVTYRKDELPEGVKIEMKLPPLHAKLSDCQQAQV